MPMEGGPAALRPELLRLLQDAAPPAKHHSYEGWNHSTAGYLTDYLICATCAVFAAAALRLASHSRDGSFKRVVMSYIIFLGSTGASFGFGGVAHMLIGSYGGEQPLGLSWGSQNSSWLFFWLPAVAFSPLGALTNLTLLATASGCADCVHYPLLATALAGAFLEIWVLLTQQLHNSGVLSGLLWALSTLAGTAWAASLASLRDDAPHMWTFSLANLVMLCGWLVVMTAPVGCGRHGEDRDCPYPEDFNQNAIFHSIFVAGLIVEFAGVCLPPWGGAGKRVADEERALNLKHAHPRAAVGTF